MSFARRLCALILVAVSVGVCGALPVRAAPSEDSNPPAILYLARRGWHTDVGFAANDLPASLAAVTQRFPQATFFFFGFGDRRYLTAKHKGTSTLAAALFPGAGLILVTALDNAPAQAFRPNNVLEFGLNAAQARAARQFLLGSLADVERIAEGPYEGSEYYAAVARYSAFHTCNTWTAEALKAAGLKIRSRGALFAGQTWRRARKLQLESDADSKLGNPQGVTP